MGTLYARVPPGAAGSWVPISFATSGGGGIPARPTLIGTVTISGTSDADSGGNQLVLTGSTTEGAQMRFDPLAPATKKWYIDRYGETIRFHDGANVPFQVDSTSVYAGKWRFGPHPVHGQYAMWRDDAPGSGDYNLLSIGGSTFVNSNAGQIIYMRSGNADKMQIGNANGVEVFTTLAMNGANVGPFWPSYGGGWFMQDGSWLRSYGDKGIYTGGEVQAGTLRANGGAYMNGIMNYGGSTMNGYVTVNNGVTVNGSTHTTARVRGGTDGTNYANAGLFTERNAVPDRSTIGLHPGGVAYCIGAATNQGWVFFWNLDQTAYCDCLANQFVSNSQRRNKQDIEAWPPPVPASVGAVGQRLSMMDRLRGVEVITYRQRRDLALRSPVGNTGEGREHFCDDEDCGGTAAEPCWRVKDWMQPILGVTVEQLAEHVPEMVRLDHGTGEPVGVNAMAGVAALIAAMQELEQRIHDLEEAA